MDAGLSLGRANLPLSMFHSVQWVALQGRFPRTQGLG